MSVSFSEQLHTGASQHAQWNGTNDHFKGYWPLNEPAGSMVARSYGYKPNMDGAVVGAVNMGGNGVAPGLPKTAPVFEGGYIEIPDSVDTDLSLVTLGFWLKPKADMIPIAPVLYFKMDEQSGTTISNLGYTGGTGSLSGAFFLNQIGKFGSAIRFDGISGQSTIPHHNDQRLNDGFLIAWYGAHPAYAGGDRFIISKGDGSTSNGYDVRRTGGFTFTFRRNGQEYSFIMPSSGISANADVAKMHFYAVWYDVNTQELKWIYDGVVRATFTGVTFPDSASTDPIELGHSAVHGGFENVTVDNLIMYNLHAIFNVGHMTLKRIVDISNNLIMNFPVGAWYGGVGKTDAYALGWNTFVGGGGLTFEVFVGGVRHIAELGNVTFLNDQAYFVAGSYDGETVRLYLNNALVASNTAPSGNIDNTANPLRIGQMKGTSFIGTISDVFLFFSAAMNDTNNIPAMLPENLYRAGVSPDPIICLPRPTSQRERIIYVRPELNTESRYLLHAPPSRVILSEEGFGTPPLEYVTDRSPFQHGENVRSFSLRPRVIQLTTLQNFRNREEYWEGRRRLVEMLSPSALQAGLGPISPVFTASTSGGLPALSPSRRGKLLCYLGNGTKRQIDVLIESGPGFAPPQGGWREWSFTEVLRFVAHDPTWYDPTQKFSLLLASASDVAQLVFPVTFPVTFAQETLSGSCVNEGNWPTLPYIMLWGQIENPIIENITTGKRIALVANIPTPRLLLIDLYEKTVQLNDGTNMISFVTSDSDLTTFTLEPDPIAPGGVNEIRVSYVSRAPFGGPDAMVWYNRYTGI